MHVLTFTHLYLLAYTCQIYPQIHTYSYSFTHFFILASLIYTYIYLHIHTYTYTSLDNITLDGWTMDKFRHMCILSGCDYLPSIRGVGLKVAYGLFNKHGDICKVLSAMRADTKKKWQIPNDYYKGNIYMCK